MSGPGPLRTGPGLAAAEERVVSTVMVDEPTGARHAPRAGRDLPARTEAPRPGPPTPAEVAETSAAASAEASEGASAEAELHARLGDVPLELTVELGRLRLSLGELMQRLTPGGVLSLGRAPQAPLEVRVQSRLVAFGEAICVGEHCGVRILSLVKEGGGS